MTIDHDSDFYKALAATLHSLHAKWLSFMFSVCTYNADDTMTIPAEYVRAWMELLPAHYGDLSADQQVQSNQQTNIVLQLLSFPLQHRYDSYLKEMGAQDDGDFQGTSFDMAQAIYAFAGELGIQLKEGSHV